jgi:hypothetical protein
MCCARVCRCRAACCAQGGAGKAHRPDRRRRARRDFPRSAKAAYSYVSERSRAATAPGGDPREPAYFVVDEHWSVEHRTPVQLSAVEPVCRSAGGPRAPGREGNIPGSNPDPGLAGGGGPAAVGPHPPGGPLSASPASGFGSNATRQHRSGAAGPERGRERGAPRSPLSLLCSFLNRISCLIRARVRRGTRHREHRGSATRSRRNARTGAGSRNRFGRPGSGSSGVSRFIRS